MKNTYIRKKILYTLFVPYFMLGLIAVLYLGYKYSTSIKDIKQKYHEVNNLVLMRINREVDYLVSDIENLIVEIELNDRFSKLLPISKNSRTGKENYDIAMALRELRTIKKHNYLIEDIILYYREGEFFLTPLSIRTELGIYEDYPQNKSVSFEQWEGTLTDHFTQGRLLTAGDGVYYIATIPFNEEKENSNIIIKINSKGFYDLLNDYSVVDESAVYLFDQNQNVITGYIIGSELVLEEANAAQIVKQTGQTDQQGQSDQCGQVLSGATPVNLNGNLYTKTYLKSQRTGMLYVFLTKQQVLDRQIRYATLMYLGGGVLFCLLLFLGLYGVAVIYGNIQAIIKRLTENHMKEGAKPNSEFDFINSALSALEEKMQSQENVLLDSCIRKAIYGMIEEEDSDYISLKKSHENLCCGQSMIAIFEQGKEVERDAKEVKLDLFILGNVLRDIFQESVKCWVIPVYNWEIVTLNWCRKGPLEPEFVITGLEKSRQFLKDYLDLAYVIGVSLPVAGMSGFAAAYKEAIAAIEEQQVIGGEKVICYSHMGMAGYSFEFTDTMETQLQNFIRLGDKEKAVKCIEDIYEQAFRVNRVTPEAGKILLLNLIKSVNKTADQLHHAVLIDGTAVLKKRYTAYGIKDNILSAIGSLCGQSLERVDSASNRQTQIKQYIEKHYKDADLNVAMIADAFHLNPSYLSRFFKDETGENLLNYINRYRVEQVKMRLIRTEETITAISAETGFLNAAALTRTFKKYEGITPGQFKAISQSVRGEEN